MPRRDEAEFLQFALKGDADAIDFCNIIFRASQVLDDLIDMDMPVTGDQITNTFWSILIDLPKNRFYRQHVDTLVPMMQVFLQDWVDATRLETMGDEHAQNIAFVLRDTIGGLVIHVAAMVGGYEWANTHSVTIRGHVYEDGLRQYKRELGK